MVHRTTLAVVLVLLFSAVVFAAPPRVINYQAKLTDADGVALNGDYDIAFSIWDAPTGGTCVWGPETHSGVTVTNGLFDVQLGTITTLDIDFSDSLWIEVEVEGVTLGPREKLGTVPYAFRAIYADTAGSDNDWQVSGSDVYTGISPAPTGNVGIGTTSPSSKLDVNGTIRADHYRDSGGGNLIRSSDGSITVSEDADGSWDLTGAGNITGSGTATQVAFWNGTSSITGTSELYWDNTDKELEIYNGTNEIILDPGNGSIHFAHGAAPNEGDLIMSGSSDALWISGADFGIGTADPSYKLEVAGDAGFDAHLYHNDDDNTYIYFTPDRIQFYTGGRSMIDVQYSDNEVAINEGGTQTDFRVEGGTDEHLLFTDGSADRVGIGTASPGYKLDVQGTGRFTGALTIGAYTLPNTDGSNGYVLKTDGAGNVTWQADATGSTSPGGSDGQVQYNNGGSFGGATDLYYDDTNNRVGIGTTSPGYKLDVNGDLRVDSPTFPGRDYRISCGGRQEIYANNDLVEHVSGNKAVIVGTSLGTNRDFYICGETEATKIFTVEGDDQQVGIGTTSPSSKLDVNGTIRADHYRDSGGGNLIRSSDGSITVSEDADGSWDLTGAGGGVGGSGATNKVAFWSDASNLTYNNNFHWDNTNERLGIGTTSPNCKLSVGGDGSFDRAGWFENTASGGVGLQGKGYRQGVIGEAVASGSDWSEGVRGFSDVASSGYNTGVYGYARNSSDQNTGVYGFASGSSGTKYGGYFKAQDGGTNYGIYATASGGGTNWAGYFVGNGYFSGNVGIGTTGPGYKLHVVGGNVKIGNSAGDNRKLYFGDGSYVWIGEQSDDHLRLHSTSLSIEIDGDLGSSGEVLKSNGSTVYWGTDATGGGGEWTDAGSYVYPNENSSIRVYEDNATYGFYYNGSATYGVYADGGSYGVYGIGTSYGVYGDGGTGTGVYGTASGTGNPGGYFVNTGDYHSLIGANDNSTYCATMGYNASGDGVIGIGSGAGTYLHSGSGDGVVGVSDAGSGVIGSHYNGSNNNRWGALGTSTNGVYGTTDNSSGAGVFGSGGSVTTGVYGTTSASDGYGIWGTGTASDGNGALGTGSNCTHILYSGNGDGLIGASDAGYGVIGSYYDGSDNNRYGYLGGSSYGVYGHNDDGDAIRGEATQTSSDDYGVWGTCNVTDYYGYGGYFEGGYMGTYSFVSATGVNAYTGVYGYSYSSGGAAAANYGLYGYASNGGSSGSDYWGVYYSGGLGGSGSKSAIVRTEEGPKALYCQESPEMWFEDFGSAKIRNGKARIEVAEDFLSTVTINDQYPMKVFITPNAKIGEWWVEKGDKYFILHAPNAEDGSPFDYRIVAKRRGYEERRLDPVPKAYTDHYLYPNINDVPQEYRLEWVKQVPPTERDPEWLKALTPEQIQMLGKPHNIPSKQKTKSVKATQKLETMQPSSGEKSSIPQEATRSIQPYGRTIYEKIQAGEKNGNTKLIKDSQNPQNPIPMEDQR